METPPRNSQSSRVAALAAQHAELAINTLVEVMRAARRNDQHRVAAARVILDLAGAAAVGDTWESKPPPSLDDLAAARERLRKARNVNSVGLTFRVRPNEDEADG